MMLATRSTLHAPHRRLALLALLALAACAPRAPAPSRPGAVTLPRREPEVRVGLLVDAAQADLASTSGFEITEAGGRRVLARARANEVLSIRPGADRGVIVVGADGRTKASASDAGVVARAQRGGALTVGGKPYRGEVLVRSITPGKVTAINLVDLEAYLMGVVPFEIGRVGTDLLDAAKAQAVAARTYAVAYRGRRADRGFDYYATVQDQVYGGEGGEHEVTTRAVRETKGQILVFQGKPIEAYYHSTCAGQTAAIDEVWPDTPRPYLVSVVDVDPKGRAYDESSSRFRWTERWTAPELNAILARTLADSLPAGVRSVGELRDMRVTRRTQSDRVGEMKITTSTATFTVGGDRIRWILLTPKGVPLNSSKFDVTLERDRAGRVSAVVANGGGWGHGIGMCQVGAMGRARAGQSYRTILQTYFPGTKLLDLY
jgi:stage II sporulation protein D